MATPGARRWLIPLYFFGAISLAGCGSSTASHEAGHVSASTRSACSQIENQSPLPMRGRPEQVVFAFPSSLIDALHHSGNPALDRVGTQLVSAAASDDPRSANAAVARAKSVCHPLVQ